MSWIASIFQANGLPCLEGSFQTPGLKHTWCTVVVVLWDAGVITLWLVELLQVGSRVLANPGFSELFLVSFDTVSHLQCFLSWPANRPFFNDFWFLLGGIVCTGGSLKSHWDGHLRALSG